MTRNSSRQSNQIDHSGAGLEEIKKLLDELTNMQVNLFLTQKK